MDNVFEFLLQQATEKENHAVLSFNNARSELEGYYEQIRQIEKYRLDYCNQLLERGKKGLTASQYSHLNKFLVQLDETLTKQKSTEDHFVTQLSNCEHYWQETRKKRRSYEWMMEKREKEKQVLLDKQEQKMMDEFSTLQYSRR